MSPTQTARSDQAELAPAPVADETDEVVEELLVEEISIDGMCGVY